MAAPKGSGVFREVPLCRFEDVEQWQTYEVPGTAACDASEVASRISECGQDTWATGFVYSQTQSVGDAPNRFIVARVGATGASTVELVEWSLDSDLFGNAVRLQFPGPIAPGSVRLFEDTLRDSRKGDILCVCLVAVTCAGTVHRLCFPHASALVPDAAPTQTGDDFDVQPSVFTPFAADRAASVSPLKAVSVSGDGGSTGIPTGGRTSCIRAEYVSMSQRRGASVSCAAWLDDNTVTVGSTSGAVVVLQMATLTHAAPVRAGEPMPVQQRFELFNAGLVSQLWGGLVGSSNASAVVAVAPLPADGQDLGYVAVVHSDRRLCVWHCESRACLLDKPLAAAVGSDVANEPPFSPGHGRQVRMSPAAAGPGADAEPHTRVLGATLAATPVAGAGGGPGRAVLAMQLLHSTEGTGVDSKGAPGYAVLLDLKLSPTAARAKLRRGCGGCFLGGALHTTPAVASDMQRLVGLVPGATATWAAWRGAWGGPGAVARHREVASGVSVSAAAGSRVALPLRVEQHRLALVDHRGAAGSLEFGHGLMEEEKFHVSRVFMRDRFSPVAVARAVVAFRADTAHRAGLFASPDPTAVPTFLAASSQRQQQMVIEAVRARMEAELAPARAALDEADSDGGDGDDDDDAAGDGEDGGAGSAGRRKELQIARESWAAMLDACQREWAAEHQPLGLFLAGRSAGRHVATPLVVRQCGVSLVREVDDVEAVALDAVTSFRPVRYDAPPPDTIDVSSLFNTSSSGGVSGEESKGVEGGAGVPPMSDALAVVWAAGALGALLPGHIRQRLDGGKWCAPLPLSAMADAVHQAAVHYDSSVIVPGTLPGIAEQKVAAYAGPWGGALVDGHDTDPATARDVPGVGISLAVVHAVTKRLSAIQSLGKAIADAVALVQCNLATPKLSATNRARSLWPAPSSFSARISDAANATFRGPLAAPLFHRAVMQHAAAARGAARDLALLISLASLRHRVFVGHSAAAVEGAAPALVRAALRACGRFRCIEWLGGRVAAEVDADRGVVGNASGVLGYEMVLGAPVEAEAGAGAGSPGAGAGAGAGAGVGAGAGSLAPASHRPGVSVPKFLMGSESIARFLRVAVAEAGLAPLVQLPSPVPLGFTASADRGAVQHGHVFPIPAQTSLLAAFFRRAVGLMWRIAVVEHALPLNVVSVLHAPQCFAALLHSLAALLCYEPEPLDAAVPPANRLASVYGHVASPWPTFTLLSAPAQFLQLTGQYAHLQDLCELRLQEAVDPDTSGGVDHRGRPVPEQDAARKASVVERLVTQQRRQYRVALAVCELVQGRTAAAGGRVDDANMWRAVAVQHLLQSAPPSFLALDAETAGGDGEGGDGDMSDSDDASANRVAVESAMQRNVASFFLSATALLDNHRLSTLTMPFLNTALGAIAAVSAGPCSRDDDGRLIAALWSKVFNVALEADEFDTCFTSVLRNSNEEWALECLGQLVVAMCRRYAARQLMAFPFTHKQLPVVEAKLTFLANSSRLDISVDASLVVAADGKPQSDGHDASNYYRILYALHVKHRSYRKAAAVMWDFSQRVASLPGAKTVAVLKVRCDALSAASNALSLLPADQAYLVRPTRGGSSAKRKRGSAVAPAGDAASTASTAGGDGRYASLADVKAELVLALGQLDVARGNMVADPRVQHDTIEPAGWRAVPSSPSEVQDMLLAQGRFERAMSLARAYGVSGYDYRAGLDASSSGSQAPSAGATDDADDAGSAPMPVPQRRRGAAGCSPVAVVAALAKACVQLQAGATGGRGGSSLSSLRLDDSDAVVPGFAPETRTAGGDGEHAGRVWTADNDAVGAVSQDDITARVGRGSGPALGFGGPGHNVSHADRAWRLLCDFLWRYDGPRNGFALTKKALQTVMAARPGFAPPPWLLHSMLGPKRAWKIGKLSSLDGAWHTAEAPRVVAGVGGGDVAAVLDLLTEGGNLGSAVRIASFLFPPAAGPNVDVSRAGMPLSGEWIPYQSIDRLLLAVDKASPATHPDARELQVWVPELVRRMQFHASKRWPQIEQESKLHNDNEKHRQGRGRALHSGAGRVAR